MVHPGGAATVGGESDGWLATLRQGDRDRYLCALAAPAEHRTAVATLYAFNLEIARIAEKVSEPMLLLIRLQWWRDALREISAGNRHRHHLVEALRELRARGLDLALLQEMLNGRETDADASPPANLAALEAYAGATAGALAEAAATASVADSGSGPGPGLRAAVRAAGTAYGLVGLLRATPHLARRRIVRLPADLMLAAGTSPDLLCDLRPDAHLPKAVAPVAARARELLDTARALPASARRRAIGAFLPGRLAAAQLERLARRGYDPFANGAVDGSGLDIWRLLIARWTGNI